jgi:hypothetical protein
MQNLATDEITAINAQVTQLTQSTAMSDRSKSMSLGLALLNLVGERTLRAAVATLGSNARAFGHVDRALLISLAAPPPEVVLGTLPGVCAAFYSSIAHDGLAPPPEFKPNPQLSVDRQAMLMAYQLVNFYGDQRVAAAANLIKTGAPSVP